MNIRVSKTYILHIKKLLNKIPLHHGQNQRHPMKLDCRNIKKVIGLVH